MDQTGDEPDNAYSGASLRAVLRALRTGSDPALRDLADDLLAGRLHLRDVATSNAVLPSLRAAIESYGQWRKQLSSSEYAELVERSRIPLDPSDTETDAGDRDA